MNQLPRANPWKRLPLPRDKTSATRRTVATRPLRRTFVLRVTHRGMYIRSPGCSSNIAIGSPSSALDGLYLRSALGAASSSSYRIHVFDPSSCMMRPGTDGGERCEGARTGECVVTLHALPDALCSVFGRVEASVVAFRLLSFPDLSTRRALAVISTASDVARTHPSRRFGVTYMQDRIQRCA